MQLYRSFVVSSSKHFCDSLFGNIVKSCCDWSLLLSLLCSTRDSFCYHTRTPCSYTHIALIAMLHMSLPTYGDSMRLIAEVLLI